MKASPLVKRRACTVALLSLATHAAGHGIMVAPGDPRVMGGLPAGVKLVPFEQAREVADAGCGGLENGDPGISLIKMEAANVAYQPDTLVTVSWELTIPHETDNKDTGVRIALHYSPEDSFENNVRATPALASR